jgi:hypothetical protein
MVQSQDAMKRLILLLLVGMFNINSLAQATEDIQIGCKRLSLVLNPLLSPSVVEREWASGNPRSGKPATLELIGCEGQVLDRLALDSSLAKLDPTPVRGAPYPTYLVSADLTVEAGSYNGPLTIPIQVVHDHLIAAVAQWPDKSRKPIHLAETLKQSWQRVSRGHVENFLAFSCWPKKGEGFETSFMRFFPFHQGWKVKVRTEDGLWESDGEFPNLKHFP